ncbi:MAG: hypothetical protein LBV20_07510 [Treponema sp.]|jgi:hypothetical protein|nr:hypothetical protein [Treponema sp.]
MNLIRRILAICLFAAAALSAFSQTDVLKTGDAAMAEKYVEWAEDSIKNGRWAEAESALERASDFADVSSDVSYLLALCREKLNRPRGAVLRAVDIAIETKRWTNYEVSSALLLKAEMLLAVKDYPGLIDIVNQLPESSDTMVLHLRALKGLDDAPSFLRLMSRAFNVYQHDPRPVSILFHFVDAHVPKLNERALIDIALRRMPLLVTKDPSLAYKTVPFMTNIDDARRLMEIYRAENSPHPESLPAALELGVIDEETMMKDFFSYTTNQFSSINQTERTLSLKLVRDLWNLLRNNESRDEFTRNLLSFSGVIVEDRDEDSYPESFARYEMGKIRFYDYDADQDRLPELLLDFYDGDELPHKAELAAADADTHESGFSAYPLQSDDRSKISLEYFAYPSVKSARLAQAEYFPVYREFFFAPVDFVPIVDAGIEDADVNALMLMYPELSSSISRLTKRSLISFANFIKRPSREFPEALEEIHLTNSVVNRAREVLPDGTIVSEMFFELGEPYLQYVDLDFDGKRETRRLFKREHRLDFPGVDPTDYQPVLEKSESDWDGDDLYEYGELYLPDGMIERSWDSDGDGIREMKEIGPDV